MNCPYCLIAFHIPDGVRQGDIGTEGRGSVTYSFWSINCPACWKLIVHLRRLQYGETSDWMVLPKQRSRTSLSSHVPADIAQDYTEACLVVVDSQKASAALTRRCLQHLLREYAKTTRKDLADQIQEVLDSKTLPSWLADDLDAVRNIGNFAAHPLKSTSTGQVVDVEPGEAEWLLNLLQALFDFYFVEPANAKARRDALNAKLADLKKPPLKTGTP